MDADLEKKEKKSLATTMTIEIEQERDYNNNSNNKIKEKQTFKIVKIVYKCALYVYVCTCVSDEWMYGASQSQSLFSFNKIKKNKAIAMSENGLRDTHTHYISSQS